MLAMWFFFWDVNDWGPNPPVTSYSIASRYRSGARSNWVQ